MGNGTGLVAVDLEEAYYRWQCDCLASAILIKDFSPNLEIELLPTSLQTSFKWINRGEVIAGSYVSSRIAAALYLVEVESNDIDIYFHSKQNALDFIHLNGIHINAESLQDDDICIKYSAFQGPVVNIIWGIEFKDKKHLISRFDIRACAAVYDPNDGSIYAVKGACDDIREKKIVFNPVPRATSIRRLVKYIEKGFSISRYQRLFFAQLIKSDIYSCDLELTTGY